MMIINCLASELLPHQRGMLLVDRALEGNDHFIRAEATVKPNGLFVHDNKIGAWVLIEYMAQTMGLWTCWHAKCQGKPRPVGFLLGTRKLSTECNFIEVGTLLNLTAELIFLGDDGVAQFECKAFCDDKEIASAKINAFEPQNLKEFLENMTQHR